jgi:hypothetical protein
VKIASVGGKGLVEISDTQILYKESLSILLQGNESTVKLVKSVFGPASGVSEGGVDVKAGAIGASLGTVEGRIFTPAGGSCNGSGNSFSAPMVQICPAL